MFVIHTVGPVWHGGTHGEPDLLASCYRRSIEVAAGNGIRTLAFPGISTGVYGFPVERAAPLAVAAVRKALRTHPGIEEVIFCCHSAADLAIYQTLLEKSAREAGGLTP
jgi:O-acetyl-ADP-ribose deacetylase (regulator of RNase III)